MIADSIERRFWRKVRFMPSGCWEWQGYLTKGYGKFGWPERQITVHRWAYERAFGPVPSGLVVMHLCDNRACVRLAHLRIGTHKENSEDMTTKGRHRNWHTGRTHCIRGHEFNEENTYFYRRADGGTKGRQCRACGRAAWRERYYRTKEPQTTIGA